MVSDPPSASEDAARDDAARDDASRAERWALRRSRVRRITLVTAVVVVAIAAITGVVIVVSGRSEGSATPNSERSEPTHASTSKSSTTIRPTTTTTRPYIHQPRAVTLPPVPTDGLTWGSNGPVLAAYQQRLKQLHFDPGSVDGQYGQDTEYAVVTVEKLLGLPRDGRLGPMVKLGLEHFKYTAAQPRAEGDRVEINLDTQVLTVFKNWQPILITTTSTGSGDHFCGGSDGCQYAITPAGHYHFYYLHRGWDKGKLGTMWNPYYFNGGIAVHGLASVPSYPASHGCARIPMNIANYFPDLVTKGESVYVVGTPKQPGSGYVGPYTPPPTTTTLPPKTTTTKPGKHTKPTTPTTTPHPATTLPPKSTTTPPKSTTSHT